jgi:hypothetical protein
MYLRWRLLDCHDHDIHDDNDGGSGVGGVCGGKHDDSSDHRALQGRGVMKFADGSTYRRESTAHALRDQPTLSSRLTPSPNTCNAAASGDKIACTAKDHFRRRTVPCCTQVGGLEVVGERGQCV